MACTLPLSLARDMAFATDRLPLPAGPGAGAGASAVAAARALTASLLGAGVAAAGSTEAAASTRFTGGVATVAAARLDGGEEYCERDAFSAKAMYVATDDAVTHFGVCSYRQEQLGTLGLDGIQV